MLLPLWQVFSVDTVLHLLFILRVKDVHAVVFFKVALNWGRLISTLTHSPNTGLLAHLFGRVDQCVPEVAHCVCLCKMIRHCFTKAVLTRICRFGIQIASRASFHSGHWTAGLIWSRYSLVIIPKNWNLFCVNFFLGCAGSSQLYRIWRFVLQMPSSALFLYHIWPGCSNDQLQCYQIRVDSSFPSSLNSWLAELKWLRQDSVWLVYVL